MWAVAYFIAAGWAQERRLDKVFLALREGERCASRPKTVTWMQPRKLHGTLNGGFWVSCGSWWLSQGPVINWAACSGTLTRRPISWSLISCNTHLQTVFEITDCIRITWKLFKNTDSEDLLQTNRIRTFEVGVGTHTHTETLMHICTNVCIFIR